LWLDKRAARRDHQPIMKHTAIFIAALLVAAGAQASCYTVMNAKGDTVSESPNPPVDMSRQLHETVPAKYGPGATMVFGVADDNCGDVVGEDQTIDTGESTSLALQVQQAMNPPPVAAAQKPAAAATPKPAATHKPRRSSRKK
jgi:hypothetical protein